MKSQYNFRRNTTRRGFDIEETVDIDELDDIDEALEYLRRKTLLLKILIGGDADDVLIHDIVIHIENCVSTCKFKS